MLFRSLPAAGRISAEGFLEAGGDGDRTILPPRRRDIADAIERRDHILAKLGVFFEDGRGGVGVGMFIARQRRDAVESGQMLAALLDWPQATFASKVEIADGRATVTREVDGGLETISVALPAIVTSDLRLNEPRYVTLPNIMKAKKKPLDTTKPADLGVDPSPRLKVLKVSDPPPRKAGIKVPDVAALVDKLKNEAKVI